MLNRDRTRYIISFEKRSENGGRSDVDLINSEHGIRGIIFVNSLIKERRDKIVISLSFNKLRY